MEYPIKSCHPDSQVSGTSFLAVLSQPLCAVGCLDGRSVLAGTAGLLAEVQSCDE